MDSMKDTENTTQDLYHCDFKKLTVIQFKFNGTNISSNEDVQNIVKKYKSQIVLEIENLRFNEDEFVAIVAPAEVENRHF